MDDEKNWEEKKQNFLDIIALMNAVNKKKEELLEQQLEASDIAIASMQKRWYDAYISVGFDEKQALDLTKNMTNNIVKGVLNGDK